MPRNNRWKTVPVAGRCQLEPVLQAWPPWGYLLPVHVQAGPRVCPRSMGPFSVSPVPAPAPGPASDWLQNAGCHIVSSFSLLKSIRPAAAQRPL